jgi:hypothetical protein
MADTEPAAPSGGWRDGMVAGDWRWFSRPRSGSDPPFRNGVCAEALAYCAQIAKNAGEKCMSKVKVLALATAMVFAASQLAFAQSNPYAGGGGAGTASGHSSKAQNNNRGPGKNPGGPGQGYQ